MTTDDQIVDLLTDIRDLLRSAIKPRQLSHADHIRLGKLLPAIAGKLGSDAFTTRELMASPPFKELMRPLNARQVGNLLSRAIGEDIGGLTVERITSEHSAVLWRVVTKLPEPLPNSPYMLR